MKIFTTLAALTALAIGFATTAAACVGVNCNQPTAVQRGQSVPVWHVVECRVGNPEAGYTKIDCSDPAAIHISPRGDRVVCFYGSDGKLHWDVPGIVHEGRTFKNLLRGGIWWPLWTLTQAEKGRLGIN
jgi:hypothetical protein